ncbi:hypothetical protein ACIQRS_28585 [Streptomyces termitum]|uniref:Uncharacterized protein n=1 Tax=Streptomyces termitum TaxID=67368 RepID=A0A918T711_9ACTN|nr:hypothetical protein [Streptomyces termitum]GHB03867.1 hypothetical protein GCM10010305_53760 [Streptomyces termitum]
MSGGARPLAYRAEIRAEGLVAGTGRSASWLLGRYQTLSPVLALRWLQDEAVRLASRLDPDPARSPWAPPTTLREAVPAPDAPAELRVWATYPEERHTAWVLVRSGEPLSLVVPDLDCVYCLSVWPLWHSAELEPPPPPRHIPPRRRSLADH